MIWKITIVVAIAVLLQSQALAWGLTWGNSGCDARTNARYHWIMLASPRDVEIVRLIGRFNMMSSGHINELVFYQNTSSTPSNRVLARLTKDKYLARIERRLVGGTGGGSGHYCYQLGSKGHALLRRQARYWPYRAINHHTIAIADVYVSLVRAERSGQVNIVRYSTEPESWTTIAGAELRPDFDVEIAVPSRRVNLTLYIEVDMGTERHKQLKDKMDRYYHAWQYAEEDTMQTFPLVVFLVPDDERAEELKWLISHQPTESRQLFTVVVQSSFPQALLAV